MNPYILLAIVIVGAYLFGSIPFGLLYSLLRGVDIRKVGSGNIGSTNVSRQFGFIGGFVPVFILDSLKGVLPVLIVNGLQLQFLGNSDAAMILAGVAGLLGHIFPIYLKFKGGKGIATSAGVFVAIAPASIGFTLLIFITVLFLHRLVVFVSSEEEKKNGYFTHLQAGVGLASVSGALAFPIFNFVLFGTTRFVLLIISLILMLLIFYTHRSNLAKYFQKKG